MFDSFNTTKGHVNIGASIGIAIYPDDGTEIAQLIEVADKHMYSDKKANKQRIS
jgi:predicted signal transduction protein with EAL and GGDEF domain